MSWQVPYRARFLGMFLTSVVGSGGVARSCMEHGIFSSCALLLTTEPEGVGNSMLYLFHTGL